MKTSSFFLSTLIAAAAMSANAHADYTWNGGATITQKLWASENSWSLTGDSTWSGTGSGPGTSDSNMWSAISISTASGSISGLEGWNLRISLTGSELTVDSLKKFQGGSCSINLDTDSVFTINSFQGGNDGDSILLNNEGIFNLAYGKSQGGTGFVASLGSTGIMNLTSAGGNYTAKVASLSAVLGTTEETETKGGIVFSNYRNLITLGSGMSFDDTVTTFSFTNAEGADITVRDSSEIFGDGISKNDDGTYGIKTEEGWVLLKDTSGYSVGYTVGGSSLALIWSGADGATWNTTDANWTESEGGESKVFANGGNVVFDKDANVVVDSAGVSANCVGVFGGTVTLSGGKVTTQSSISIEDGATLKLGSVEVISGAVVVKTGGTFDLNGASDGFSYAGGTVNLAGGFLTNTGDDVGIGKRQLHSLVLTADSTIGGEKEFGIVGSGHAATTVDLGGNTLTKVGSGTVLFANNTLSNGVLDVAEGTISDGGKNLTVANNATLKVSGGRLNITGNFVNNGTLEFSADSTYSGRTLSGGTLNIADGTTVITGTASVKVVNASGGTLEVGDGGVLTVNDGVTLTGGKAISGTVNVLAGGATKFSGHDLMGWSESSDVIAVLTGSAEKNATLYLNDTGNLTFTSVVKMKGNALVTSDSGAKLLNTFGGKFVATGMNNTISDVQIQVRKAFEVEVTEAGDTLEISSVIASHAELTGGLTKTGFGVLALSGSNTSFDRTLTVSAGTLVAANTSALGSGVVSVADGAKLQISVQNVDAGTISLASGATLVVDLADFAEVLGADTAMLTILTGTTLTFGNVSAASDTLTTEQLGYLSVTDSSGAFSEYVNKEWSYDGSTLSLTLTIPEPSAFGLLAGLSAVALCVSRRRRVKKA